MPTRPDIVGLHRGASKDRFLRNPRSLDMDPMLARWFGPDRMHCAIDSQCCHRTTLSVVGSVSENLSAYGYLSVLWYGRRPVTVAGHGDESEIVS